MQSEIQRQCVRDLAVPGIGERRADGSLIPNNAPARRVPEPEQCQLGIANLLLRTMYNFLLLGAAIGVAVLKEHPYVLETMPEAACSWKLPQCILIRRLAVADLAITDQC